MAKLSQHIHWHGSFARVMQNLALIATVLIDADCSSLGKCGNQISRFELGQDSIRVDFLDSLAARGQFVAVVCKEPSNVAKLVTFAAMLFFNQLTGCVSLVRSRLDDCK